MLCYVTVTSAPGDRPNKARITGIYETEEQARRSLGADGSPQTSVFQWPMIEPPRFAAPVEIHDGHLVPLQRSRLLDALDNALKREQIAQLYQLNDALTKQLAHLADQLPSKISTLSVHGQNAESTARQVRDLWLSHRQEDAIASVVRDYVNAEKPTLAGRIIATADAATAVRLNTRAQDMRLGDGNFDPTQGIAHDRILLHVGDRVQFGRTDAELGVKDRELGDVVAIFPQFRTIAVAIDERKLPGAEVVLLSLNEYADIDLAYATTYDRAKHMELHQVFVLADSRAPTRQFVESLPAFHLQVYADAVTASKCFPEHADGHYRCPSVDLNADPLGAYRQRE